jgi:hypothetical protein
LASSRRLGTAWFGLADMGYFLYKLEAAQKINSPARCHRHRMLARARRRGYFVFVLYITAGLLRTSEKRASPEKQARYSPPGVLFGQG